jgi:hypothetical protein
VIIKQVDYYCYENSELQSKFHAKQLEFKRAKKSDKAIWVFHGTSDHRNIGPIMKTGFLVGGQNGHPISNGEAYGQGVYSATGPATPMGYGRDASAVILAQALPGRHVDGNQSRFADSWTPRQDWYIFARSEQVLPCYVVRW